MMRKFLHYSWTIFFSLFLFFISLVILTDLFCETYGLPDWACKFISRKISQKANISFAISYIRGGVFSGITLKDIQLKDDQHQINLDIAISQLKCKLSFIRMAKKQLCLKTLRIKDFSVKLKTYSNYPPILFSQGDIIAHYNNKNTIDITATADAYGIEMHNKTTLTNFTLQTFYKTKLWNYIILPTEETGISEFHAHPKAEKSLTRLCNYKFGYHDASLNFTINGDMQSLDNIFTEGSFQLKSTLFASTIPNLYSGHFTLVDSKFHFDKVLFMLGSDQILKSDILINIEQKTVQGTIEGEFNPFSLLQKSGLLSPSLLKDVVFHTPPHIYAVLPETPLSLKEAHAKITLSFHNTDIKSTNLHHGQFTLNYQPNIIAIEDLLLALDFSGKEKITGNLQYLLKEKSISGKIHGKLFILKFLDQYDFSIPNINPNRLAKSQEIFLELQPSSPQLDKLKLNGFLKDSNEKFFGHTFKNINLPFQVDSGNFTIQKATVDLNNGKRAGEFTLKTNYMDLIAKKETAFELQLQINAENAQKEWTNALRLQSKILLDPQKKTLGISSGEGDLYISRFYNTYQPIFSLPKNYILSDLITEQIPVHFNMLTQKFPINAPEQFVLQGTVLAKNLSFNNIQIQQASTNYKITSKNLELLDVQNTLKNKETVHYNFSMQYNPFIIKIDEGKICGRPSLISPVIESPEIREKYNNIWKDITWNKEQPAEFLFQDVVFSTSDFNNSWSLKMQVSANIKNIQYKKHIIHDIHTKANFDLPTSIKVESLNVVTNDDKITGHFQLLFPPPAQCQFSLNETTYKGKFLTLLAIISPKYQDLLANIKLSESTNIGCDGNFTFNTPNPVLKLNGTVDVPSLSYKTTQMNNVKGTWSLQDQKIFWNITEARLKKGNLLSTGFYDANTNSGETQFYLTKIPLQEATTLLKESNDTLSDSVQSIHSGSVDTNGKLRFYYNWAGRPLLLEGDSHVTVYNANIWKIPLLSNLGKLISAGSFHLFSKSKIADLGEITQLDADMNFHGDRLIVTQLKTDGTLIALSGDGVYSWEDNKLDFCINGQALKSIYFISTVLKPLSWVFQANLTGTPQKPEWKIQTALQKIFSTK
ncbi:MAG: hypothetical protein WCS73_06075 [Lentisphaeria bacterium]